MRYRLRNGVLVPYKGPRLQRGFITCGPAFFGGGPSSPYATWDASVCPTGIILSGGNLTAEGFDDGSGFSYASVRASLSLSGNRYFQVYCNPSVHDDNHVGVGIGTATSPAPESNTDWVGSANASAGLWDLGSLYHNGAIVQSHTLSSAYTVEVAYKSSNRHLWIGILGFGYLGGGNPATDTTPSLTMPVGTYYPYITFFSNGEQSVANFGATSFGGSLPSGFAGVRT